MAHTCNGDAHALHHFLNIESVTIDDGSDNGVTTPFSSTIDVATVVPDMQSAATAVPASSPLHYFLKIDGVTGD